MADETPAAGTGTAVGDAGGPAGTGLAADPGFLLARARAVGDAAVNAALAPVGLKVRSLSVLWLAVEGGGPSQREVGQFLGLDPSQVVGLVDELQGRGLLERRPDARDRRSRVIVATPAGRRLLRRARESVQRTHEVTFGGLDAEERRTLAALLARVAFPAR